MQGQLRRAAVFLFLITSHFPPPALFAYEDPSKWSIGLEAGLAMPSGPAEFSQAYNDGTHVGMRVRQELTDEWAVAGSFSSQSHKSSVDSSQKLNTQPLTLVGIYSLARTPVWNPYAALGLGVSRNTRQVFAAKDAWTKLTASLGLGLEWRLSPFNSVGVEGAYRHFTHGAKGEKDFQTLTLSAALYFYLPDSWIPEKPRKPLPPPAPMEAAPAVPHEVQVAQEELNKVQQDILEQKIPPILFETGQAVILPESYETLDIVGTIVKRYPQFSLRIEGHTDNVGSDEANLVLSQARTEAVRAYIIHNFAMPPDKITAVGYGEMLPVDTNETEEGRARNRRVEFKIIQ